MLDQSNYMLRIRSIVSGFFHTFCTFASRSSHSPWIWLFVVFIASWHTVLYCSANQTSSPADQNRATRGDESHYRQIIIIIILSWLAWQRSTFNFCTRKARRYSSQRMFSLWSHWPRSIGSIGFECYLDLGCFWAKQCILEMLIIFPKDDRLRRAFARMSHFVRRFFAA